MKLPESIPEIANKSRASVWIIVFALLLLLFNICTGSGQTFDVPYSTTVPTIDGVLNPIEWAGSSSNVVTTIRGDKAATNTATIYFKHDGTWLYVGISSKWGYGWDVYNLLVFDGNNNHTLDGNLTEPHTDIQTQVPSPGAWSGYNRYMALLSSNNQQDVTAPSGTARASAGSTAITYEYKIALSDLGVSPGGLAGFAFMFGTDGTGQHGYYYPITVGNWIADPSQWAHVKIQNLPPTTGLVAYYPFDGNANDATGRGHDGTVHGATLTADRFGSLQNAYYFDGNGNYSGNYIEIPASSDLDNRTFTISAWAKRSSNPGAGATLVDRLWDSNTSNDKDVLSMTHYEGSFTIYYNWNGLLDNPASEYFTSAQTSAVPENTWFLWTLVKNGSNLLHYINGQQVSHWTLPQDQNPYVNSARWLIGAQIDNGSLTQPFKGSIDDVRFYNRALSSDEIWQMYSYDPGTALEWISAAQNTGEKKVSLKYNHNIDPSATITVQASDNGGSSWSVPLNTLSGNVGAGVPKGQNLLITWDAGADWNFKFSSQMKFRITAVSGAQNYSAEIGNLTVSTCIGPPDPPASLFASDNQPGAITISWGAVNGAVGYELYRSPSPLLYPAKLISICQGTTMYQDQDPDVSPTVAYYYWVKATNRFGKSGNSPAVVGIRALAGRPSAYGDGIYMDHGIASKGPYDNAYTGYTITVQQLLTNIFNSGIREIHPYYGWADPSLGGALCSNGSSYVWPFSSALATFNSNQVSIERTPLRLVPYIGCHSANIWTGAWQFADVVDMRPETNKTAFIGSIQSLLLTNKQIDGLVLDFEPWPDPYRPNINEFLNTPPSDINAPTVATRDIHNAIINCITRIRALPEMDGKLLYLYVNKVEANTPDYNEAWSKQTFQEVARLNLVDKYMWAGSYPNDPLPMIAEFSLLSPSAAIGITPISIGLRIDEEVKNGMLVQYWPNFLSALTGARKLGIFDSTCSLNNGGVSLWLDHQGKLWFNQDRADELRGVVTKRVAVQDRINSDAIKSTTTATPISADGTMSVPAAITVSDREQLTCIGWTGTGEVPVAGTKNEVALGLVASPSTITWLWQTDYLLDCLADTNGTISPSGSVWCATGTNLILIATPDSGYRVGFWTLNGSNVQYGGTNFSLSVVQSGTVTVSFVAGLGDDCSLNVQLAPFTTPLLGTRWNIDGTGVWSTNGTTVSGLSTGTHTLAFTTIPGWISPTTTSLVFFTTGSVMTITGTYSFASHVLSTATGISGSSNCYVKETATYVIPPASCSCGSNVRYSVDWGDWDISGWLTTNTADHTWLSEGTFAITCRARCSVFSAAQALLPDVYNVNVVFDSDSDGVPDADEIKCGTDRYNPESIFKLRTEQQTTDGTIQISWPSADGHAYTIEMCTNILDGFTNVMAGIEATPPTNHANIIFNANHGFYRVRTQ